MTDAEAKLARAQQLKDTVAAMGVRVGQLEADKQALHRLIRTHERTIAALHAVTDEARASVAAVQGHDVAHAAEMAVVRQCAERSAAEVISLRAELAAVTSASAAGTEALSVRLACACMAEEEAVGRAVAAGRECARLRLERVPWVRTIASLERRLARRDAAIAGLTDESPWGIEGRHEPLLPPL